MIRSVPIGAVVLRCGAAIDGGAELLRPAHAVLHQLVLLELLFVLVILHHLPTLGRRALLSLS
jgi:hypothetical protein